MAGPAATGAADLLAGDRRAGGHRRLHAVLRRRSACSTSSARSCSGRWCGSLGQDPPRSRACLTAIIRNPILPGFNPDPSIVRVGDDYYIATSTFEWFPGVQIHHSRDLVNWRLLTRPLRRASQLDMRGDPDSCGVWAPCLTYADGLFHLIYTDVKRYGRTTVAGRRAPRCATSTTIWSPRRRIDGDWSDPVYLNSSGFDPSLFHDDDGRKYLRQHAVGPPARPEPLRRHRAAGILAGRAPAGRRAAA